VKKKSSVAGSKRLLIIPIVEISHVALLLESFAIRVENKKKQRERERERERERNKKQEKYCLSSKYKHYSDP